MSKNKNWYELSFFKYATGMILLLLIIFLLGKIDYFLVPFRNITAAIFLPILISVLLYYLLRPVHKLLTKIKIPASLSILIVFVLLLALIVFISGSTGVMVATQVKQLLSNLPDFITLASEKTTEFLSSGKLDFISSYLPLDQINQQISSTLETVVPFLTSSVVGSVSAVANFAAVLLIVPFILFYFLKDDKMFYEKLQKLIPDKHRSSACEIIEDVDKTLSVYIIGQAIVALTIGILLYISYLIIGVDYALILALFGMITAFIPILGAFIGAIPAVLIGLTVSPWMALKVIIVIIIAQQLEGNLISPQIMGKRMNIHPLTFIIVLLAAAAVAGFIGMLVAVPCYAVAKVLIKSFQRLYKLKKDAETASVFKGS
ncbi:MAG: AI-2E family transporter [Clostridiales bacterium]|nr:AI-2E family transporter [Clostridiales bacterium]